MACNLAAHKRVAALIDVLAPFEHSPPVTRRRSELILLRIHWVAATFAVLTPLWILIDALFFPAPLWHALAILRVIATLGFISLAIGIWERILPKCPIQRRAHRALGMLFSIPTAFFFISVILLDHYYSHGLQSVLMASYVFLPFVMIAGLSVFPLTALEGGIFAAPMVLAMLAVAYFHVDVLPLSLALGAVWLLALLAGVSILAGMGQLHLMIALIQSASKDPLTQAYSRRTGEELLDIMFVRSTRASEPLSVAFVDLDDFKEVNDHFGHEEGDSTLRQVGEALRAGRRQSDVVIRWGGEEFLLILPDTRLSDAVLAIERLRRDGLGSRPNGTRQTASVGIAEWKADHVNDWSYLIELADQRMYQAKQAGKNRVISITASLKGSESMPSQNSPYASAGA